MSISLNTLFTTPTDIWNTLSVEGVDLTLDDHWLATGQTVSVTADAIVGATTISVSALPVPLLRGALLTFDNAGMSVPVTAQLTAVAAAGATSLTVSALDTQINSGATARDSGVNVATGARLAEAARRGTSRVKLFCNQRYDDSQLRLSGSVQDWATIIACRWLCTRRRQGCPKSLQADYDETMELLQMVQKGQLAIEDCGTRDVDWPAMSNITVDPRYNVMQSRVEQSMSEGTPTVYGQYPDWNSIFAI